MHKNVGMGKLISIIAALWLVLICINPVKAQNTNISTPDTTQRDTLNPQKVYILHADDIFFEQKKGGMEQLLIGDIALYQDSTFFYCDTAIIFQNQVWAQGNIQIIQGDSTSIFSDSLYYSGDTKQAELFGEVILEEKENQLFTEQLKYDLQLKEASYEEQGILIRGSTNIKSNRGRYFLEKDLAVLSDSVIVIDSNFVLQADTLEFDTEQQIAIFKGPTQIEQDENSIYCEDGYYDLNKNEAVFSQNAGFVKDGQNGLADVMYFNDSLGMFTLTGRAQLWKKDQKANADNIVYFQDQERAELYGNAHFEDEKRSVDADIIIYDEQTDELYTEGQASYKEGDVQLAADVLRYDESTGNGTAIGQVEWRDTANDIAIFSDRLEYNKETDYVKATGTRPWIEIYMDGDTMFVGGDTLISDTEVVMTDTTDMASDTFRRIRIYNHVGIYKSDIQGICDSLVYSEADSVFRMYNEPVLWSDTSQFSADTIHIFLDKKNIDYIHQIRNSLIINSTDLVYFNQIKGKQIRSFFEDRSPDYTLVEGNAQSLYFATDDEDAYIAGNKSICSRIKVDFVDKKISEIMFLASPKAEMLPMKTPGLQDMRLEGFKWIFEQRPRSKDDVLKAL